MNIKTEELYARHRDYIINEIGFPGLAVQGIIYYIEKENYLKILNRYGLVVLQYLMQYALEVGRCIGGCWMRGTLTFTLL
jgi:hypothetical protein